MGEINPEEPFVNGNPSTKVAGPFPEVIDGDDYLNFAKPLFFESLMSFVH